MLSAPDTNGLADVLQTNGRLRCSAAVFDKTLSHATLCFLIHLVEFSSPVPCEYNEATASAKGIATALKKGRAEE